MRLVGVGLRRTGTLSVKVALEKLGIGPVHHGFEFAGRPDQAPLWEEAIEKDGDIDWNRIFGDYEAVMDWPTLGFWEKVTTFYPEAKVLLTERDAESWFTSSAALLSTVFQAIEAGTDPAAPELNSLLIQVLGAKFAPHGPLDREHAIAVFKQHYESVRGAIEPDRLLIYHCREGWEPLCSLLGTDVPDEPFPRVNASDVAYQNAIRAITRSTTRTDGMTWL